MVEANDLGRVEQRVFRSTVQDGLRELVFGIFLFFMSGAMQEGSFAIVMVAVLIGFVLIKLAKNRYTYTRTGYATLPEAATRRLGSYTLGLLLLALVITVVVLLLTGDISHARKWYRWTPIFFGVFLSGAFLMLGVVSKLRRYWLYAVVSLVLGIGWSIPRFPDRMTNISYCTLTTGIFLIVCSAIVFANFLRTHPVRTEDAGNDEK